MRVIPVIDIKDGYVVWARAGERDSYRKLRSWLCPNSIPIELIDNYINLGFQEIYVADLDSIEYRRKNYDFYRLICKKAKIILDCGIRTLDEAVNLDTAGIQKIVVATETLPNLELAKSIIQAIPRDKLVLSLDLFKNKVLSPAENIRDLTPISCLKIFKEIGFGEAIVIDLSRIGTFSGLDINLIEKLSEVKMKLIVGGGIRDINDIILLEKIGVDGVLIASSLHNKKISIKDLIDLGYLVTP